MFNMPSHAFSFFIHPAGKKGDIEKKIPDHMSWFLMLLLEPGTFTT